MKRRLQVMLDDEELRHIQATARRERMTTSEWARQALRAALRTTRRRRDAGRKLAIVRAAVRHAFPSGDIDQMLRDIDRGRAKATR